MQIQSMRHLKVMAVLCAGIATTTVAFAEKYAVIDVQKAASDTNYMRAQMASLDSSLKPQRQNYDRLTRELNALRQKAQTDGKVMKPEDVRKLEQDYNTKLNEYNSTAAGMQKRAQDTLVTINKTLAPKIEQATEELRKAGGYSAVFNRNAVVSLDSAIDLTSQVTQRVNASLR